MRDLFNRMQRTDPGRWRTGPDDGSVAGGEKVINPLPEDEIRDMKERPESGDGVPATVSAF